MVLESHDKVPSTAEGKRKTKWKPEEDGMLLQLLGKVPIETIQATVGRSASAIHSRSEDIGISFVGAAEVGRLLGMPKQTVIRKLEAGYILGEQVGHYWKIRATALGVKLQVEEAGSSQDTAGCCPNCGNPLPKENRAYCGKKCYGEYIPGMVFPPHLRVGFQRFLGKVGLVEWRSFSLYSGKLSMRIGEDLSEEETKVTSILVDDYPGRIVPPEWLRVSLATDSAQPTFDEITQKVQLLRGKLVNPKDIYEAAGLGWGVGVQSFDLSLPEVKMLRHLWQKEDLLVPMDDLRKSTFDPSDKLKPTRRTARSLKSKLEQRTSGYSIRSAYKETMYKLQRTKTA